MSKTVQIIFRSSDGIKLPGTISFPKVDSSKNTPCAIFVHGGGGVDRNEDGFFLKMSQFLNDWGIATLRFDHRAFLAGKEKKITVTISGIVNDITKAIEYLQAKRSFNKFHLISASFSSGAALMAGNDITLVKSIILINPLINYKKRLLLEKGFWKHNALTRKGVTEINAKGFLKHGSALKMSPALITEVARMEYKTFWSKLQIPPTMIIHGTRDSRISHLNSIEAKKNITNIQHVELIEGADHGLCAPGDDNFEMPKTFEWHQLSYNHTKDWILENNTYSK